MEQHLILRKMHKAFRFVIVFAMIFFAALSLAEAAPVPDSLSVDTEYVTDSDAEKLIDKYTGKVGQGIGDFYHGVKQEVRALAESLSIPAKEVLEIYGNYHFYRALIPFFVFILSIPLFILGNYYLARHRSLERNYNGSFEDNLAHIFFIVSFLFLAGGVISIIADQSIVRLLNPQYFVIQDILEIFK